MEYEIKPCGSLPCATQVFTINGHSAEADDFGSGEDTGGYEDKDEMSYGCVDHQFLRHDSIPCGVLSKYAITESEWETIAEALEAKLSVGACNWCD